MIAVKNILVPVDFSENSKKVLQQALNLAGELNANILVVHVVESLDKYGGLSIPHISLPELEKGMVDSAKRQMENFLEDNMEMQKIPEFMVLHGDIVERINSIAESEGADMIVIGTHGHKGLEKILFGSVAERIVKTAPCPVLTINPYK